MRLTPRGWVVLAAVVIAMASAAAFGPRGLNAIAAPGIVALVAGLWQVYRTDPPTLERTLPERGERGTTARVRLDVSSATPRSARVVDEIGLGLDAEGATRELVVGDATIDYELHLRSRGRREVGPATVTVRDVLGLLSSTYAFPETETILVHPRVHLLSGPRNDALARLHGGAGEDRRAFDGLRRYRRGDPLRDIHWRTSAKQPDTEFVVKQFAIEEGSRTVEIAAGAAAGEDDAMAEAVASIGVALLESGARIGITTPNGRIDPEQLIDRRELLDHLAEVGYGPIGGAARRDADLVVEARSGRVAVTVGGQSLTFTELAGTSIGEPAAGREATA